MIRTTVPPVLQPTDLLPSPNGAYVSPQQWHALFAQGIVIKDVSHKFFTDSQPPPSTGGSNTDSFNSTVDMHISTDGGNSFQFVRVTAPVSVRCGQRKVRAAADSMIPKCSRSDLTLHWRDDVMIRESPDASVSRCALIRQSGLPPGDPDFDLLRIGSFFDIFPEVSLDGGATWSPATNGPVRMQLTQVSSNSIQPKPNLPPMDGNYVSPAAMARAVRQRHHYHQRQPRSVYSDPAASASGRQPDREFRLANQRNDLDEWRRELLAVLSAGLRRCPGQQPFRARSGNTRFFDTEMLSLQLQGAACPAA